MFTEVSDDDGRREGPTLPETIQTEFWRERAACKNKPLEWFFDSEHRWKPVCTVCTVRESCLQYALDNDIPFGVWGGMTPKQRHKTARHKKSDASLNLLSWRKKSARQRYR